MILTIYAKIIRRLRGSDITKSFVHKTSVVNSGSKLFSTSFNRYSYCGYDCKFINSDIGAFCSIASGVIIGGAHHPVEYVSTSPVFLSHKDSVRRKFSKHEYNPVRRTKIGSDVWIGERALVKSGVSIGHGAVIGMGAVVTKDVPPYAIVGGNPARIIRMRFSQAVIDGMLKLEWWNFSEEGLLRIAPLVPFPDAMLKQEGIL
jgi:acetyltransferase-like isoleucine patch superfamily enzyme